jgi:hypothetical protein
MKFQWIVVLGVLLGICPAWGIGQAADPDQMALDQLKSAGSDLSKPHKIEFLLYFPDSKGVAQAAATLNGKKFDIDITRPKKEGEKWSCKAIKTMVPDLKTLQKIRKDFNNIAAANGGEYDGWGAAIVK